jgi:hypothetical protein
MVMTHPLQISITLLRHLWQGRCKSPLSAVRRGVGPSGGSGARTSLRCNIWISIRRQQAPKTSWTPRRWERHKRLLAWLENV